MTKSKRNNVVIAAEKECPCEIKAVMGASHEPFTYRPIWRCRLCHHTEYKHDQKDS